MPAYSETICGLVSSIGGDSQVASYGASASLSVLSSVSDPASSSGGGSLVDLRRRLASSTADESDTTLGSSVTSYPWCGLAGAFLCLLVADQSGLEDFVVCGIIVSSGRWFACGSMVKKR